MNVAHDRLVHVHLLLFRRADEPQLVADDGVARFLLLQRHVLLNGVRFRQIEGNPAVSLAEGGASIDFSFRQRSISATMSCRLTIAVTTRFTLARRRCARGGSTRQNNFCSSHS